VRRGKSGSQLRKKGKGATKEKTCCPGDYVFQIAKKVKKKVPHGKTEGRERVKTREIASMEEIHLSKSGRNRSQKDKEERRQLWIEGNLGSQRGGTERRKLLY